jgi:hypothetical protein
MESETLARDRVRRGWVELLRHLAICVWLDIGESQASRESPGNRIFTVNPILRGSVSSTAGVR